jgi:bifunctional non-homologous end joining protein LigD
MPRHPTASNSTVGKVGSLAEYSTRRSFDATPEPGPEPVTGRTGPLLFVVQQHAARKLHYDFRIEIDGVLLSWAVPNGFDIPHGKTHLAVPTEAHPMAYGSFEGVIPKGQYGAGNVIVWDCGIYSPDEGGVTSFDDRDVAQQRVRDEVAAGKLSIFLLGEKLKGSYALVRTKDKAWLLLKHRDKRVIRPAGTTDAEHSVLSLQTVATVPGLAPSARLPFERLIARGPAEAPPAKLAPMLSGMGDKPFVHRDWLFEPKLDGYRAIALVGADGVKLRSRNGIDLTAKFPGIAADLRSQLALPLVIDGEIVALRDGRPSFGALQDRAGLNSPIDIANAERTTPCLYFCFDLLHAFGMNLRGAPYADRRRWLAQCVLPSANVHLVHADADGEALFRAAVASGFEGVMAKRRASTYQPGKRTDDWLKIKHVLTSEFVVGGWTAGNGARRDQFGALALGAWDDGRLVPVGNVGSGFDDATLAALMPQLEARSVAKMPFAQAPEADGRLGWVRPELVAEVQFAGLTDDALLRAPVFVRLRKDVDPRSIRLARLRELTAPAASPAGAEAAAAPSTAVLANVLQQLDSKAANLTLAVDGQRIKLTHLDKPLWPAHTVDRRGGKSEVAAQTKRDLLRYLATAAPFMLPHLARRPLTVIRMPDGIHGEMFFQKHWDAANVPPFVRTIDLVNDDNETKTWIVCDSLPTLLWLGQMATIEFHAPHASVPQDVLAGGTRVKLPEDEVWDHPDYVVFDLDPYIYSGKEAKGAEPEFNAKAFAKARDVAFHLRDLLAAMQLTAYVKTTGKTGLHIFVPVERTITTDQAREVCRLIGTHLLRQHPKDITMDWAVEKRTGRIFFDHNMNGRGRTLNAAYSPRRIAGAWVCTPVTWDELATAEPGDFRLSTMTDRLRDNGDPWQGILDARHDLARVLDLRE